ncbi:MULTISPECIES: SPOR domain-containing protein [unclassified Mesorhizobium]|uniref:SPOR domain-containing protein n=1 Tax=unclassified Mesorhizobium TaxID=325217 RepID=UPI0030142D5F
MVDRTQLKIADRDQLSNDDPFAELTRIMGFDPRQPVQQEPAAAPSSVANVEADDFGIDLEKELMGEFAQEDSVHDNVHAFQPAYRTETAYQPEAPAAYEPEILSSELDVAEFEALEPQASEGEPAFAAQPEYEPTVAFEAAPLEALAHDAGNFDDAVAAELEDELSLDGEWSHAEVAVEEAASPEYQAVTAAEYEPASDQQPAADYESVGEYEAVAEYEPAAEFTPVEVAVEESVVADPFDQAVAASFEDDQPLHGEWSPADEAGAHVAYEGEAEPVYETAAASEAAPAYEAEATNEYTQPVAAVASEEAFADDFDEALAEVDMDFTAVPLKSSGHGSIDPELDKELEIALQPEEPVSAVDESGPSLEDELNALLGNVPAHHAEEAPVVEAVAEEPAYAIADEQVYAVADEPAYVAAQGTDEEIELELADEDMLAETPYVEAPQPVVSTPYSLSNYRTGQPAYAAPADEAVYDAEPVAEAEADIDLEFDDEAFDAAFANSIEDVDLALDEDEHAPVEEPPVVASSQPNDPYADLAALTAQFTPTGPVSTWNRHEPEPQPVVAHYDEASDEDFAAPAASYNDVPDIETIDVPEQAVALAEDLDIPELAFEEDVPAAPAYDDIDAEFASLLNDMNSPEPAPAAQPQQAAGDADDFAADFEREFQIDEDALTQGHPYQTAAVAGAAVAGALGATAAHTAYAPAATQPAFDTGALSGSQGRGQYQQPNLDDFDYDPDSEEEMTATAYGAAGERERPQRRGMLIAAVVGGIAVIGAIGAYALSGGNVGSGAPALVKADDGPIKIRPENPGGTVVPNQDNKVYDTVSRTPSSATPTQEKLVTTAEEPMDMAAQDPEPALDETDMASETDGDAAAPMAKSEDRIQQIMQENGGDQNPEVAAVTPRKVRTMVVKSDGTLVPREDPAPAAPAIDPATTASESVTDPVGATTTASVPDAKPAASLNANEPVPAEANAAPKAAAKPQNSTTPKSVAIAPTRPSDQPVDVVGEVKADQVAALAPASAAAAGAWSMQIASQPSQAAAQSSYQDLQRRYGSVLNGHQANIVKAEIAGKGTFWRVRVPAPSRNEAISLCESYKAAGGNCFVSK